VVISLSPPRFEVWMSLNDDAPILKGAGVMLRQLRLSDAVTLFTLLTDEQVAKFISPPPTSPEGYERFIEWTIGARPKNRHLCFGVVPEGLTEPVGIFQLRRMPGGSNVAEWGFVIGYSFWGTGIFVEAARLLLEFAFDVMGVYRLEARASVPNGRGQGALAKVGAFHEVRMRESFTRNGQRYDQVMWSILADEWRQSESDRHEPREHDLSDDQDGKAHARSRSPE
jgi:RimJ/RimL family protein N-acetyltransferase